MANNRFEECADNHGIDRSRIGELLLTMGVGTLDMVGGNILEEVLTNDIGINLEDLKPDVLAKLEQEEEKLIAQGELDNLHAVSMVRALMEEVKAL